MGGFGFVRRLVFAAVVGFTLVSAGSHASHASDVHPIVGQLRQLLQTDPALAIGLRDSLTIADVKGLTSLDSYFAYVDRMATRLPSPSLLEEMRQFYYLVSQSDSLKHSKDFQDWLNAFATAWAGFMDTPASAATLEELYRDPAFRIDDYQPNPSGWLTFNQFFARQVKPGKRPVAAPVDDTVVVSPVDGAYQGFWPVSGNSKITVKGQQVSITELLAGSRFAHAFSGGVFTHSFLRASDYHRFHTPVAGKLLEKRNIPGRTMVEISSDPAHGGYFLANATGFQVAQARGLIVLENDTLGLVAVLPIGMGPVSSVVLTPDLGANLQKGEEFGYFQFGGSDIVTVYQAGRIELTAEVGKHYLQGQKLGAAR